MPNNKLAIRLPTGLLGDGDDAHATLTSISENVDAHTRLVIQAKSGCVIAEREPGIQTIVPDNEGDWTTVGQ